MHSRQSSLTFKRRIQRKLCYMKSLLFHNTSIQSTTGEIDAEPIGTTERDEAVMSRPLMLQIGAVSNELKEKQTAQALIGRRWKLLTLRLPVIDI